MNSIFPRLQSWWLLSLATVITIAIVAASQLFTDRISLLLDRQASELLAADMLITASHALPESYQNLALEYGLKVARSTELRSAIFIDDEPQLVEIKAVSDSYPLRGSLEKKKSEFASVEKVTTGPQPGEFWVDSKLSAQVGSSISLGYVDLPVQWMIHFEPDRGGSLFNLAPRVMMHENDLPATGLLVEGSRAKYKLLIAGEVDDLQRYEAFMKPLLKEGEALQSLENARPEMRMALERTRRFFALSIVMTLVIAMVAIAITARYSASRESTRVAVMRTFGISSNTLLLYYLKQITKVWLWSLPAGLLVGLVAQYPIQWMLGFWFDTRLPEAGLMPYFMSALIGLVSLMGFSLPPILRVIDTPPMQVLRSSVHRLTRFKSVVFGMISLITLFSVLMLIVADMKLAALLFIIVIGAAALIPLVIKGILLVFQRLGSRQYWLKNYILSRLLSPQRNALFVMSGFSLTLLAVLLISLVKNQLLMDWENQLPTDKPNYFLVNIPSGDVKALEGFLQQNKIPASSAYALVRARLTAINGQDVKHIEFEHARAERLLNHVFNISYASQIPQDNQVVEGDWLGNHVDGHEFSVEQGMAQDMGLKLGDDLQFTLAGAKFNGVISSIRSVEWDNFRPNFYILGTQESLQDKPQTWLLSAYISEQNKALLKPLIEQFPSVTLLDISELMSRIKGIIERASLALEFFFLFALLAAIVVLVSALKTANRDRELELALLQALGAGKSQKLRSQIVEFIYMGFFVGLFAAFFANAIGYIIAERFFDLKFSFSPQLWGYSFASAIGLITSIGMIFIYRAYGISPMRLLRS